MPSPESLLERESSRSRTEVDEVEMFLKEKEEVEEVESFLLSLKEKSGRGEGEDGTGEADEGHSEKIPESRWLSQPTSLERTHSHATGNGLVCVMIMMSVVVCCIMCVINSC